ELDSTVPSIAHVQVSGCARLLWQKSCQVRCSADAQLFDVCRTIGIHRIRTGLLSCGNVRASDNDTLDLCLAWRCWGRWQLSKCDRRHQQTHCRYAPFQIPREWLLNDKLPSLVLPHIVQSFEELAAAGQDELKDIASGNYLFEA